LPALDFCLTAKPDRVDAYPDGTLHILDYKTGTPPSAKEQKHFDKQLLLEAAMAEQGAFESVGARRVARISYIGVNAAAKVESTEITPELLADVWGDLHLLVGQYRLPSQGYAYLYKDNIENILNYMIELNRKDEKLLALADKIKNAL
jgi:RecB family exonuclease